MDDQGKKLTATGSNVSDWFDNNGQPKSNDYALLGNKYRLLSDSEKQQLITAIISLLKEIDGPEKEMTINLQLCHWFRIDMGLGMAVANGLNINLQDIMKNMQ
ncbi:MAG: catalase-related domain-containing protein [Mucilaginibacter sp.]|uniref:catalase-related domain-containing protein n=1 Tax=Mucilaginibacter sp. TaxID=1882438 RepID=UPI0032662E16